MKQILIKAVILVIATAIILGLPLSKLAFGATVAANRTFTDVSTSSWAFGAIESAINNGLMNGMGDGIFGYGRTITRAEFVTVLSNMFGWSGVPSGVPSFTDVSSGQWFYSNIEMAVANGVVDRGATFNPNTPILRQDMAVMLVKALGYGSLAERIEITEMLPFADVSSDRGYIIIAHDIGMISGVGDGRFAPNYTATREQAAAMITRVYDRKTAPLNWVHGFYAFESFGQRELIRDMDAVSFGWSVMEWDAENGARLNTSTRGGNHWRIPSSYELIANFPRENGATTHLNIFMDTSIGLNNLISDERSRNSAVEAILYEATRIYEAIGRSPYDGVTINFEGLRGERAKAEFTTFLTKLSNVLRANNLSLYVTVHPATIDSQYFDGYDYRAIGQLADKVILMVHDYHPQSLEGFIGTEWQRNAAITPIAEVYRSLKAITDPTTGVQDISKIAIGLSFGNIGWLIDENGRVVSPSPVSPSMETVYMRMNQPNTYFGWSEIYRNPYIIYSTENNERVFLWYEDSRSVSEKLKLARLFGVTGTSVWRMGIIPNEARWDVWENFSR